MATIRRWSGRRVATCDRAKAGADADAAESGPLKGGLGKAALANDDHIVMLAAHSATPILLLFRSSRFRPGTDP